MRGGQSVLGAEVVLEAQLVLVRESAREYKVVLMMPGGSSGEGFMGIAGATDAGNFLLGDMTRARHPGLVASNPDLEKQREEITNVGKKPQGTGSRRPLKPVPDDDDEGSF